METKIENTTYTDMDSKVDDYSVSAKSLDEEGTGETKWRNTDWEKNLGYYKTIPELKKSIDALAMWTVGRGWDCEEKVMKKRLEGITGWGEDSFQSILWNALVVKKINGDSYTEIIRDTKGELINLKPLNPKRVSIIINEKGIIEKYTYTNPKGTEKDIRTIDMLHLSNDRIANEIHGTSVIEACKWIIDARNESMSDWRRVLHRSSIRVMYIDADNTTRLNTVKTEYAEAINAGELLIVPAKKGEAEFQDLTAPPLETFLGWIRYLEDNFYKAVGVNKVILGGSDEFTEASSKVGVFTFEQPAMSEQQELITDLWNQLAIRITLGQPPSIKDQLGKSEAANTGQLNFQPKDTNLGMQRSE